MGDLNANEFINVTGCYGAAHGDHKYKANTKECQYGKPRDTHRTHVFHILEKILRKNRNKIDINNNNGGLLGSIDNTVGNIILGDLQETLSTSTRDNHGGINYKPPKHGVLNAIKSVNKHFTSVVREYEGQNRYITRESLGDSKGGRGISHILVESFPEDMYFGGCVDNLVATVLFLRINIL